MRHTAAAVGIAAAIAGLGGAAVYAATDTHGSGHHGGPPGMGGPPPGMRGPNGPDRLDTPALHSEAVTVEPDGSFTTTLTQTGTVTELTGTSVTVRSNDGFTQSYVLPAGVVPGFGVDDGVLVQATRPGTASAEPATVTSIGQAAG